jgi:hypothetical protein
MGTSGDLSREVMTVVTLSTRHPLRGALHRRFQKFVNVQLVDCFVGRNRCFWATRAVEDMSIRRRSSMKPWWGPLHASGASSGLTFGMLLDLDHAHTSEVAHAGAHKAWMKSPERRTPLSELEKPPRSATIQN